MYKYQIDEITSANLKIGEDEELHEKRKILSNSHKLHKLIDDSLNYISRSSGANAMDCISYAIDNLNTIAEIDEDRAGLADDLHNIYAYMEDIVNKFKAVPRDQYILLIDGVENIIPQCTVTVS